MALSLFFTQFSYASAQSANSYPASWQYPGSGASNESLGFGTGDRETFVVHTATSSIVGATIVSPYLCYTIGNTGTLEAEVWLNGTTTGTLVASSTIEKNVLPLCITSGAHYLGSSTPFLLNRSFNATAGQSIFVRIRQNGGTGNFYFTGDSIASPQHFVLYVGGGPYISGGKGVDAFVKIGSGYLPYSTAWADMIEGAKADACDGIIECAIAWAFYPDPGTLAMFQSINFASSSPFGYMYDMDTALQTFMTALNATSSSFKITLDMTTLGNTADVFDGVSTSSITVFDICWVNRAVGELPENSFRDTFLPMIVFMMWIGLGWLFYSVSHKIF